MSCRIANPITKCSSRLISTAPSVITVNASYISRRVISLLRAAIVIAKRARALAKFATLERYSRGAIVSPIEPPESPCPHRGARCAEP